MPDPHDTVADVESRLEQLGRLSRAARRKRAIADMSPDAVERRLRRVSQLRELCRYLMRLGRESGLHDRPV